MAFQKQFYATRQDLLPGILGLESEVKLQYVLRGMFSSPTVTGFLSASDIPDLGIARYGDYGHEQKWLVTEAGVEICVREVPQQKGGVLYDIGLMANPTAFAFQPAGQFEGKTIILGSVDTATGDPSSLALCKRFWRALSKGFRKVRMYYVGPEAYRLLEQGWRLTLATQRPPDLDLRLAPSGFSRSMSSEGTTRLSYEQSCRVLQRLGYPDVGAEGVIPPIPDHRPQIDQDPLGITFFRTRVGQGEHDLTNLTLPRTFFGRSEIASVSFKNTDLSESSLCWNDFNGVDFTDADLSGCDLRASMFREVNFVRTSLRDADLRRSRFEACDFTDADMRGAKLTRKQGEQIILSDQQRNVIDWQESDGEQPPGG